MKRNNNPVLALDVGGTNIRVAAVSNNGSINTRYQCKTNAIEGQKIVVDRLIKAIDITVSKSGLALPDFYGICVSIAGSININSGLVNFSPHLPGWKDVPLRDIIADKFGVKTEILNDASAAAIGEHRCGTGKGYTDMVHITIGTGIGGGLIINNKLFMGADGIAGEFGHMSIIADGLKCNCGNRGCLEMYASGTAIEREARRILKKGATSLILTIADNNLDNITSKIVLKAALSKDSLAIRLIENTAYYFGIGLANIVNIFNPEIIVVSGGLSNLGEQLLKPARKVVKERAFTVPAETVRIVRSSLGDNAGLIGAAMYLYDS